MRFRSTLVPSMSQVRIHHGGCHEETCRPTNISVVHEMWGAGPLHRALRPIRVSDPLSVKMPLAFAFGAAFEATAMESAYAVSLMK